MVFSSVMLISVAKASAEAWQYVACFGEHQRIDGQQMVDLVLCFPLQQLGRLFLYLWTFLCVPPHQTYYTSSYYDDNSSDDHEDGEGPSFSTAFRYVYHNRPSPEDDNDDDDSSSNSD